MISTEYTLPWIEHDVLLDLIRSHFGKAMQKVQVDRTNLSTDPTLNILRSFALNLTEAEIENAEQVVAITKTLQNAIGDFHQDVLGNVPGWRSMGRTDGVYDIESLKPVTLAGDKHVIAEVKMRYNTIKGSEKKNIWQDLEKQVRSRGKAGTLALLIEIIPQRKVAYDRPWKVSRTEPVEYVRHVDGVTGYYYVTGHPTALHDLFLTLPSLLIEAFPRESDYVRSAEDIARFVEGLCASALPALPFGYDPKILGHSSALELRQSTPQEVRLLRSEKSVQPSRSLPVTFL
ncbi:Eco47II family restriction endonuclease [Corynebacterium kozikiae]|uniref:Eco47II family restriction endonuclease n=1 Tax=Corynebacterium kozikiae TaxID=2968469 RepID=UPI00211BE14C|nr:Eco47II family restriction endonuclease [Corynebacterium sp. 76QC2CO]MCQ9343065.1 Eco47II family restriction endonuclease [Corynebacterium sp. 76QC2CO]